jgi:lipopolysaccharide/colanic/teichoic acid biosynthesis glycosyltransferase
VSETARTIVGSRTPGATPAHVDGAATSFVADPGRRPGSYERFAKPLADRVVGVAMTIVSLPLLAVLVPMIWWKLGRPAIFRQRRVGRHGREFTVYKLRTMEADRRNLRSPIDHPERRVTHKTAADPRHTSMGRRLRRWSLDEVPQAWNLARGEMSLVGPRPELPSVVARYQQWQHRRHEVRPGLTGLWQITSRGETPMHEATDIDIEYVDNLTFLGDLRILLRTPAAIFGRRRGE